MTNTGSGSVADFNIGDKVRIIEHPRFIIDTIAEWLTDKVGTVVEGDPGGHDYCVRFSDTPRQGGVFALTASDLVPNYDYEIQGDYGFGHGWEMVDCVSTPDDAEKALKIYDENEPGVPHRIKRVPCE
jgi:hypothetical protein